MRPYIITLSSEKGGVGKTTVATNLAIYLKALCEDLPVTIFSFDNHFTVDRLFRISKESANKRDIFQLFAGAPAQELTELGQFGVQFVPSSRRLPEVRELLTDAASFARLLAASQLGGIVIIDTRPDLDAFTLNALFTSDRVIVPVKDLPSLENCKYLYEFFDRAQLSRRAVRLLPCLIDARIRFEGPFRDMRQLLRAYAINRGYRCMDGCITRSPKVDSLQTNPDGKVYPIISYGQNSDVHNQFTQLARQVLQDYRNEPARRLGQIAGDADPLAL